MDMNNIDLQSVLERRGIDPIIAKSFIGYVSWNINDGFYEVGKKLNSIENTLNSKPIIKDFMDKNSDTLELLFFSKPVPEKIANRMFEIITLHQKDYQYNTNSSFIYNYSDLTNVV